MDRNEVLQKIRAFTLKELLKNLDYPLKDDEPLFSSGLIDSFAMAQVGVFIETEFDLYIPDPELTVENMDTVALIADKVLAGLAER
ncbi:MAG TPA: acyl carrier protein [Anaerolineales bacterium]|nr:acyl carrier protein [Anaerolineales bacterium]